MDFSSLFSNHTQIGELSVPTFVLQVAGATLILILARLLVFFVTQIILKRYFNRKKIDIGRRFTITRLIMYVLYTLAILLALETVGVKLSVLWAGSAALLVGVGLGLQQTFNDLVSGLIILGEGTVEVGDIVVVNGLVGKVKKIGLRTSMVETRDEFSIIIPNSKLVVDNVTNWSHNETPTRFQVPIGVAYSSDPRLIERLVLEIASEHPKVLDNPEPIVEFNEFGDSSLNFNLHFWSYEFFRSEIVKSDIRYAVMEKFTEHNIEIPFPQRDIWLRNDLSGNSL